MKFIIHNGDDDSIMISGETIEEIKENANQECQIKRGWKTENCWSERIDKD